MLGVCVYTAVGEINVRLYWQPQVSPLELRKQYEVPKRCVPHVRRKVEAKKSYTASTGQLYVNIATLKKGDVFVSTMHTCL